jgi:hypothetical protein
MSLLALRALLYHTKNGSGGESDPEPHTQALELTKYPLRLSDFVFRMSTQQYNGVMRQSYHKKYIRICCITQNYIITLYCIILLNLIVTALAFGGEIILELFYIAVSRFRACSRCITLFTPAMACSFKGPSQIPANISYGRAAVRDQRYKCHLCQLGTHFNTWVIMW